MPQKNRLERIFENANKGLDAIAIVNGNHPDPNFFYVSGYSSGLFEGNWLFLFPDTRVEVLTNPLEEEAARQTKDYSVPRRTGRRPLGAQADRLIRPEGLQARRPELLRESPTRTTRRSRPCWATRRSSTSPKHSRSRGWSRTQTSSRRSRSGQDNLESRGPGVPGMVKEKMTERALKAQIDYSMVEDGRRLPLVREHRRLRGELRPPPPLRWSAPARKGDNVLVDVGARYHLYCSDITRTFFFGNAVSSQRDAYSKVLEAQTKAMPKSGKA